MKITTDIHQQIKKRMVKMKNYIIDRFEGNLAVSETADKEFVNIPKYKLPLGVKVGDCLIQDDNDIFTIDLEKTENSLAMFPKKQ